MAGARSLHDRGVSGLASAAKFGIGDRVRVRHTNSESWRNGEVVEGGDKPKVKPDGSARAFTWAQVEHVSGGGGGGGGLTATRFGGGAFSTGFSTSMIAIFSGSGPRMRK